MIAEHLKDYAESQRRIFSHDRSLSVGASEIGQCARKTWYRKNDGEQNEGYEDRWGATLRGSVYENCFWYPALRAAYGDRLVMAGPDQQTLVDGALSATPDGLVLPESPSRPTPGVLRPEQSRRPVVVECKTADPRTRLDGARPEHVYQIQVQIGLIRNLTPYKPLKGVITYTDASFWDEIREFSVVFDPAVYREAEIRARRIMHAKSAQEIRPEGYIAGAKECSSCPFTNVCGVARQQSVPEEIAPPPFETLDRLHFEALAAKAARQRADGATIKARVHEQHVKEILTEAGTKKASDARFSVSWAAVKGRPAWDMPALRAAAEEAGLDLSAYETTGEPTDRLTITLKGNHAPSNPQPESLSGAARVAGRLEGAEVGVGARPPLLEDQDE